MSTKKHDILQELLSGLLPNYKKPEDLIGDNGRLKQLTKLLVERALDAELTVTKQSQKSFPCVVTVSDVC